MGTYAPLFSKPPVPDDEPVTPKQASDRTYYPISLLELETAIHRQASSSPGVDGLILKDVLKLEKPTLQFIYNAFLYLRDLPVALKQCRTVLIPKAGDLADAANWRPLTILSIFVRLLHNILAFRLRQALNLHPAQQAFIAEDGVMANTLLLDYLINVSRKKRRTLSLVSVDVAKAFDSVPHSSLRRALRRLAVEDDIIEYILNTYKGASTTITCGPSKTGPIRLTCGVKQGDPLSPLLFNAVIDELVDYLPEEIGVPLGAAVVRCLCFADDIVLVASSEIGMTLLLEKLSTFMSRRHLRLNPSKCASFIFRKHGKSGRIFSATDAVFTLADEPVPCVQATAFFTYLGVEFNPNGKVTPQIERLKDYLGRLGKSPLKPQQKLEILRTYLIPRFVHLLSLSLMTKKILKSFDAQIRHFVKKTLRLPHYTPDAVFYTALADGGLGLSNFACNMPLTFLNRLDALQHNRWLVIRELVATPLVTQIRTRVLQFLQGLPLTKPELKRHHATSLHNTVYGKGLHQGDNRISHYWLGNAAADKDGRSFLKKLKLRYNLLPCRGSPANRGDRTCRSGCGRVESLSHILQACPISQANYTARHNKLLRFLYTSIDHSKFTVLLEPRLTYQDVLGHHHVFKPDILVLFPDSVVVCDVGISWEGSDPLSVTYAKKRNQYNTPPFLAKMALMYPDRRLIFHAFVISARGLYCADNDAFCTLVELNRGFKLTAVKIVLEQGIFIYQNFMKAVFHRQHLGPVQ